MSMKDFAQMVGCNYWYLGQIERGVRYPSPILALRFATILSDLAGREVAVDEFFVRLESRRSAA